MPETPIAIQEKYVHWASPNSRPTRSLSDNSTRLDKPAIGQEKRTSFTGMQAGERLPQQGLIVDLSKRKEHDHLFSKEWLIEEVARERQKPILEDEVPWYHLAGTGFWVKEEVGQLMRNVAMAGKENVSDVLEGELSKLSENVKYFEYEYLKQMISIQWPLAWVEKNGEQRLMAPNYKNKLLEDVTSDKERDGVVSKTLFGTKKEKKREMKQVLDYINWAVAAKVDIDEGVWDMLIPSKEEKEDEGVEGWLRTAPADSFAVLVSAKGPSGLKDAAGRDITYPESQIYAIKKLADGTLQAYTFRTDATIEQNEAFQCSLDLTIPESSNPWERIKNTFKNVALITPEDAQQAENKGRRSIRSFEDIIDSLQDSVGGRKTAYEERTFDEMRAILQYPERFSQCHPLTEKLIARGQDFIRWRFAQGGMLKDIETDLQIALAMIPTQLHRLYREEKSLGISQENGRLTEAGAARRLWQHTIIRGGMNYRKEKEGLEAMPGCANGSEKTKVTSMGHERTGEVSTGFTCPKCGETASLPVGDKCPNILCGITKDEFIAEGGEAC